MQFEPMEPNPAVPPLPKNQPVPEDKLLMVPPYTLVELMWAPPIVPAVAVILPAASTDHVPEPLFIAMLLMVPAVMMLALRLLTLAPSM